MIIYKQKGFFDNNADILVNPVNTMGISGKGLALEFKQRFPINFFCYEKYCKEKKMKAGDIMVYGDTDNKITIINIATKDNWRNPSKYEWIECGLGQIRDWLEYYSIDKKVNHPLAYQAFPPNGIIKAKKLKISIPALGCGNGGLNWEKVKLLMEKYLSDLDHTVYIFEPSMKKESK